MVRRCNTDEAFNSIGHATMSTRNLLLKNAPGRFTISELSMSIHDAIMYTMSSGSDEAFRRAKATLNKRRLQIASTTRASSLETEYLVGQFADRPWLLVS